MEKDLFKRDSVSSLKSSLLLCNIRIHFIVVFKQLTPGKYFEPIDTLKPYFRKAGIIQSIIVTGYGLDDWDLIPSKDMDVFRHHIQTGSGVHQASSKMGTVGSFFGSKSATA
jgi:hypothetical protein